MEIRYQYDVMSFAPNLGILPAPQRVLWPELSATPADLILYGDTALALRLGHRTSVDFDFFSNAPFDAERLAAQLPYLKGAERLQVAPDTLTCRIDRDGPVLISFFGGLGLGKVQPPDAIEGMQLAVASLLDIAGTMAAVVQARAEAKDYLDIDALLRTGMDLATMLAAGTVVYGRTLNPVITMKALSFFDDLPQLPADIRQRLSQAVAGVEIARLPVLTPFLSRNEAGRTP